MVLFDKWGSIENNNKKPFLSLLLDCIYTAGTKVKNPNDDLVNNLWQSIKLKWNVWINTSDKSVAK